MDWEKIERSGIALSIIALAVLGCLVVSPPWTEADADEGLFTVILILEHYDCETGVRHRYVKTGDLLLKNFAILIADSFRGAAPLIKVTTTSGSQKTPYWYYGGGVDYLAYWSGGAKIYIGSGTGAPSPSDYKLQSTIKSKVIGSHGLSKSDTNLNITVSTTFTFDSSYTITEAGLSVEVYHGDTESSQVLIARDTFAAIEVSPGDVLTVTYTFKFNQG